MGGGRARLYVRKVGLKRDLGYDGMREGLRDSVKEIKAFLF